MQDTELRRVARWRGRQLVASDGAMLGKVEAVLYDFVSGKPVWIGVGSGPFGLRTVLVPVDRTVEDGEVLRTEDPKALIEEQPPVDVGEGFDSLSGEDDLHEYFSVPFDEHSDIRVLRRGSDLPGLEDVEE